MPGKDKPKPRVKDDRGMAAKSFKDFQNKLKPTGSKSIRDSKNTGVAGKTASPMRSEGPGRTYSTPSSAVKGYKPVKRIQRKGSK